MSLIVVTFFLYNVCMHGSLNSKNLNKVKEKYIQNKPLFSVNTYVNFRKYYKKY